MSKYNVITIEREYASGGRKIGELAAKILDIPFYDKEIIDRASAKINMTPDLAEYADEAVASSLLYSLSMMGTTDVETALPIQDRLYIAEHEVIRELAEKGPCVMIGRCADYILRQAGREDCLNVFVYADKLARIKRAVEQYEVDSKNVDARLKKHDRKRAGYYNMNTDSRWGGKENYHICLNSSQLGLEVCAEILAGIFKAEI